MKTVFKVYNKDYDVGNHCAVKKSKEENCFEIISKIGGPSLQYICKENISAFFKNGKFHAKTKVVMAQTWFGYKKPCVIVPKTREVKKSAADSVYK